MKKHFMLLFLFSSITLFSQYQFSGEGTEVFPYQIWSVDDLNLLRDSLYHQMYVDPNWSFNKHFRLIQDINTPVTQSITMTYFYGHFYGNNKKITLNLNVDETFNNYTCAPALFAGITNGGSIDSLIVDGYINSNLWAGGIANGIGISSKINGCINNAAIKSFNLDYGAGGIIFNNVNTISSCINNGDITGVNIVGGIAGQNDGTIINCINTGKIIATNSGSNTSIVTGDTTPNNGVGGIVACVVNSSQNILNCVNIGSVVGQGFVGGIVGLANGNPMATTPITNCINYGYVRGINIVGGVLGYMFNQNVNVSNCVNVGVIEGEEDTGRIVGKE
ncbi:MAG: hypothetical protein FWG85_06710 [Bacteroidetes bacterium]|nr:hypothetical protein [Bacteroidota bacterium]